MKSYTPPPRARGSRFGACGIGGADFWVRTTENGEGAFVFCSEEVFQREIDDAVERALYACNSSGLSLLRGPALV